jgi:hypothetical protein
LSIEAYVFGTDLSFAPTSAPFAGPAREEKKRGPTARGEEDD